MNTKMERGDSRAADKLFKKICQKTGKTIRDHTMISPEDHILLGLSGGKDSMVLLEILAERRVSLPFNFQITAAHISVKDIGYKANVSEMEDLCRKLGIRFIHKETAITEDENKKKGICFLCSWHRRKALFDLTVELNCNKLALGHHRYDALETLLLNMIYHGSISALPYKLTMFSGRVELIRPLLDMEEGLLQEYADHRNYNSEGIKCGHEKKNRRDEVKNLILEIKKIHEVGAINMFRSMDKIFEEYLPQKKARIS